MQQKDFEALVDRLEVYSSDHPSVYRLRVGLLAALGYLFLFGAVAAVLLLVAAVIYVGTINFIVIKFLIIPLGMAAIVLRSLWIENPKPEGLELSYNDAPKLFELAEEVRKATDGPRVHKLLLSNVFNASVVQRSRLGVLGWQENYLVVGLPLLQALCAEDFRAVVAHEFGHLSGHHGKFSGWIYRIRQTWAQVLTNMRNHRRYGSGLFENFFNWYAPYFAAYSFVLARAQEYEADDISAQLSGKDVAARALINLELKDKLLNEQFWPALYGRADEDPKPPSDAFAAMLQSLRQPLPNDQAQVWFVQSLTRRHGYDDTHPALADRLAAIGFGGVREEADVNRFALNPNQLSSADEFLTLSTADFVAKQNRLWREQVAQSWSERHTYVAEGRLRLNVLEEKQRSGEITIDEEWERAKLTAGTQGYAAAAPLLKEIVEGMPDHAGANYMLGEALLQSGDEAGIKHIEVAMEKEPHSIPAGCELIYLFLMGRQRKEEATRYQQCILDYYNEVDLAEQERQKISKKDNFSGHSLAAEAIQELRAQLSIYPKLGKAYLVRKVVKHFPDEPSFVLGVIADIPWYGLHSKKVDQKLVNAIAQQVKFPGYTYIIALEQNYKPLRKVFRKIEGAEIYSA